MDCRSFLITSSDTVAAAAATWAGNALLTAASRTADLFDARPEDLRHLDDRLR